MKHLMYIPSRFESDFRRIQALARENHANVFCMIASLKYSSLPHLKKIRDKMDKQQKIIDLKEQNSELIRGAFLLDFVMDRLATLKQKRVPFCVIKNFLSSELEIVRCMIIPREFKVQISKSLCSMLSGLEKNKEVYLEFLGEVFFEFNSLREKIMVINKGRFEDGETLS